jgi:hypothetical protein
MSGEDRRRLETKRMESFPIRVKSLDISPARRPYLSLFTAPVVLYKYGERPGLNFQTKCHHKE